MSQTKTKESALDGLRKQLDKAVTRAFENALSQYRVPDAATVQERILPALNIRHSGLLVNISPGEHYSTSGSADQHEPKSYDAKPLFDTAVIRANAAFKKFEKHLGGVYGVQVLNILQTDQADEILLTIRPVDP